MADFIVITSSVSLGVFFGVIFIDYYRKKSK